MHGAFIGFLKMLCDESTLISPNSNPTEFTVCPFSDNYICQKDTLVPEVVLSNADAVKLVNPYSRKIVSLRGLSQSRFACCRMSY